MGKQPSPKKRDNLDHGTCGVGARSPCEKMATSCTCPTHVEKYDQVSVGFDGRDEGDALTSQNQHGNNSFLE